MEPPVEKGTDIKAGGTGGSKVGKDFIAYLPAQVVPALMAFISVPIITRFFEPGIYGTYTLLVSAATLVTLVLFSWLYHSILRFYDQQQREQTLASFLSTVFITWLSLTALFLIMAAVVIGFFRETLAALVDPGLINLFYFLFLLVVSHSLYLIVTYLLRAGRYSKAYALLSMILPVSRLLLAVLLVTRFDAGVEALVIGLLASELALGLLGLVVLKVPFSIFGFSLKHLKTMATYGIPLVGAFVLNWLLDLSDRYIIGYFHGTEAVGIYSIAYNLGANSIQLVYAALMMAAYAQVVATWNERGRGDTEKLLGALSGYYFILTVPILAGIVVLGKPILAVLTTGAYSEGYLVLPWVAGGLFFFGFAQYLNKGWELTGRTRALFSLTVWVVVVNIALNLMLVPRFGFVAAGVTTLISYLFYVILAWVRSRQMLRVNVDLVLLAKVTGSALVMAGLIAAVNRYAVPSPLLLILEVLGGALIYGLLLLAMGVGRREARQILRGRA